MIRAIDAWIAKRLAHPPIIWVCQRAGITQYAFYRYTWWIVALWALWTDDHRSWAMTVYLALFAFWRTLSAGLALDRETRPALWLRCFFLVLLMLDLLRLAVTGWVESIVIDVLVLLAEYATTIHTIPPREVREPRSRLTEVRL